VWPSVGTAESRKRYGVRYSRTYISNSIQ
jgi:hypothetical protein